MGKVIQVLIVRDREAAGGGIFHYYQAVGRHLKVSHVLVDVGRSHGYYSSEVSARRRTLPTPLRVIADWAKLSARLVRFPDLVVLNPCLDPIEFRSLPRDAVNLLLAKLFGRKVLVFWRGWDNEVCGEANFPGGNRGLVSRIYRLADANLVLAGDFRDDLRRWGFTKPVLLETTVVADSLLEPVKLDEAAADDGVFRLLYLSRIEVAKGVFELLEAFALLESRAPGKFHLMIAGDGPDLNDLKRRAAMMELKGIEFAGYVDGREKSRCFADASAFCFLSYTEGMPNAVLEAMSMGLPLVSSDAGGLKDILEDGVTGYILRQDRTKPSGERFSADEVANRLEQLADSPVLADRMGRHNAAHARERFSAKKVAERLEKVFREVVGRKGG